VSVVDAWIRTDAGKLLSVRTGHSRAGSARDDGRAGGRLEPRPATEYADLQPFTDPASRVRDQRGMDRKAGGRSRPCRQQKLPICRDFYGSDGTRTRDLRRDRPVLGLPG